jgi:pyranose oxidase
MLRVREIEVTIAAETIQVDVLIAGTGPIGCTFARCFAEHGRTVLMIDAGAQLSRRPGEHLKNSFMYQRDIDRFTPIVQGLLQPISLPPATGLSDSLDPISFRPRGTIRSAHNPRQDPYLNLPGAAVSYGVGGMFSHWTSNTPRHHPELERVSWISDAEWDELYNEAESLLNTRRDVYRDHSIRHRVVKDALAEHFGNRLEAGYPVDDLPVAGERRQDNDEFVHFTGADTILGPLVDPEGRISTSNLQILPEHRLTRLVGRAPNIEYAEVEDLKQWRTFRVEASVFVVACGSLLTPQVLWKSDIRPPALGRYLTEHPMTFTQIVLREEVVESIRRARDDSGTQVAGEEFDPVPVPMHDAPPMVRVPVCAGRPWHAQVHRDSFSYGQLPPDVDDRLVVDLRWFGMVDPNFDNRIFFLDDLNDKFGMPKPTFEFQLSTGDRERIHDMMLDMVGAAHALGGFLPGAEPRFMPLGSSLHFMGTTRMGLKDDATSVVDPYSRVWGYENLILGGNGVIPTSTASNPTLTSVALALRSASSLLGAPVTRLLEPRMSQA